MDYGPVKLIEVEWDDAVQAAGWHYSGEELASLGFKRGFSYGLLLMQTNKYIWIAGDVMLTLGESGKVEVHATARPMRIPKGMIRQWHVIKEIKKDNIFAEEDSDEGDDVTDGPGEVAGGQVSRKVRSDEKPQGRSRGGDRTGGKAARTRR